MPLLRVTSVMLVTTGIALLIVALIHTLAGFGFFSDDFKQDLKGWWTPFVFMFFSAGFGVFLAGGVLVHAGMLFVQRKGGSLGLVAYSTLYLFIVSIMAIVSMSANIFSWIIAAITLVVMVAFILGFAGVRALDRRKKKANERQSNTGSDDLIK